MFIIILRIYAELLQLGGAECLEMQEAVDREVVRKLFHYRVGGVPEVHLLTLKDVHKHLLTVLENALFNDPLPV